LRTSWLLTKRTEILFVPDDMLGAALAYSRMGLRVFPLHTVVDGRCSCSKDPAIVCASDPPSPGKHPRVKGGFKAATTDQAQIRRWWTKNPDSNIGIATGSGLAVIDIDGEEGAQEFKALVLAHGPLPATLVAQTGNGFHAFYSTHGLEGRGEIRSTAMGRVHTRGEGGYVCAVPSKHISGRTYRWVQRSPIAELPDWVRKWTQGYRVDRPVVQALAGLGPLPAHLKENSRNINALADEALKTVWTSAEQSRLASALAAIPANEYESWYQIGMALQGLGWQRSDGTDVGFELWNAWSETCSEKYSLAGCEQKWNSFARTARGEISLGTVYRYAQQNNWAGGAPDPAPKPLNGVNGHHGPPQALPAPFGGLTAASIFFPDLNEDGKPRSTCANATVAVGALGITCKKDLFHEKFLVAGQPINAWAGDMSDDVIQMIRKTIRFRFGFDPKVENTRDACTQLCLEHQFDPVCDYLDALTWDGTPRLDTWLTRYMGAPDTELNRVIGRVTLIAAVRRAYDPGAKFDQIVVFESVEGKGKSTAIEILAGADNFSDQHIMGLPGREQQEAMAGVWLYEIADLTGMKKTEVEQVKAFASRKVDRARPAYGRFRVDRPRRTIFFATTNDNEYLKSETGNRRFWPVVVGAIDLAGLRRDRNQLWAEAAAREAAGDSVVLPERLWSAAADEQDRRKEGDDWLEKISNYIAQKGLTDVTVSDVLCDNQWIQRKPDMVSRADQMRAGAILKRLRFVRYHKRIENGYAWRYRRSDRDPPG
jgi:hypothetical protein